MALEIERKFLVNALPPSLPSPVKICQGYLADHPDRVVRVRTMGEKAFLTVKGRTVNALRQEYEYPIPFQDACQMLEQLCLRPLVEKNRFHLIHRGFEWVIDVFFGVNQGLVLAEIELGHRDQAFPLPDWAGKEVTQDPKYFNANLIARPFSSWDRSTPSP